MFTKSGVIMNLIKNEQIEPYINPDGWYTQCPNCWTEIYPRQNSCHKCNQLLDWSWLKEKEENHELKS